MQYTGSSIGISDEVIIDDINYEAIPGPSFTPGIGGTYKQDPLPFKPPPQEIAQFDIVEPSPGCEYTLSAGDDTIGFCSAKKVECELGRPYEPTRRFEPLRESNGISQNYDGPSSTDAEPEVVLKNTNGISDDTALKVIVAAFLLYVIWGRRSV